MLALIFKLLPAWRLSGPLLCILIKKSIFIALTFFVFLLASHLQKLVYNYYFCEGLVISNILFMRVKILTCHNVHIRVRIKKYIINYDDWFIYKMFFADYSNNKKIEIEIHKRRKNKIIKCRNRIMLATIIQKIYIYEYILSTYERTIELYY